MKKLFVSFVAALSLLFVLAQDMPATVVDIAVGSPDHTTLVAAVTQAELVEALSGEGPFTVFAPTDAAFEAAIADMGITAEDLLANPDLAGILQYHVVSGKLLAADVLAAVEAGGGTASVETLNGAPIEVTVADGVVTLNGTATVTVADLEAGNGVVHVTDGVLMPPAQ
ncbi:MAG: fasciclin domain-containing protein [Trueperaceae bacterium]